MLCPVRFSSSARLLSLIPEHLQRAHRSEGEAVARHPVKASQAQSSSLWDGWGDAPSSTAAAEGDYEDDGLDLGAMGL